MGRARTYRAGAARVDFAPSLGKTLRADDGKIYENVGEDPSYASEGFELARELPTTGRGPRDVLELWLPVDAGGSERRYRYPPTGAWYVRYRPRYRFSAPGVGAAYYCPRNAHQISMNGEPLDLLGEDDPYWPLAEAPTLPLTQRSDARDQEAEAYLLRTHPKDPTPRVLIVDLATGSRLLYGPVTYPTGAQETP